MKAQSSDTVRQLVRDHYGKVAAGGGCGCGTETSNGCRNLSIVIPYKLANRIR